MPESRPPHEPFPGRRRARGAGRHRWLCRVSSGGLPHRDRRCPDGPERTDKHGGRDDGGIEPDGGAADHRSGNADADRHDEPIADRDPVPAAGHTGTDRTAHCLTDLDPDGYSDANVDSDAHSDPHSYSVTDSQSNPDTVPDTDTYDDTHADSHSDSDTHADADRHVDG